MAEMMTMMMMIVVVGLLEGSWSQRGRVSLVLVWSSEVWTLLPGHLTLEMAEMMMLMMVVLMLVCWLWWLLTERLAGSPTGWTDRDQVALALVWSAAAAAAAESPLWE